MCKTITSKKPNGNSIFGKNERYLHRLNISYKQRGLGSADIISKNNKNQGDSKMKKNNKESGRYPVTNIQEVIERITEQLQQKVIFDDKITYINVVKRSLKRPIDFTIDIVRLYDKPTVINDKIFISSMGIKEGAIKVEEHNKQFYCKFYNYDNAKKAYIFKEEDIYSTARCAVEIFGGTADLKINIEEAYKNLGCALANLEAESYLESDNASTKAACLKTLMNLNGLTNGMSIILIRKLQSEPEKVAERLKTYSTVSIERRKLTEKNKSA